MWSTSYTDSSTNISSKTHTSSDFETHLSSSCTFDFGGGAPIAYEPNTFRPGRFENLANALENEFNLGFSTTNYSGPSASQQNQETPAGNSKVSSQLPPAFSAPEYGLDSIEGFYVLQGLRPKQGTHTFSSRFQQLLDRKLQAEAAAKSQQRLSASQQSLNEAERACSARFPSGNTINTQLQSTTSSLFVSASDYQAHHLTSSLLGQMTQAKANPNYAMHSSMRDVQNGTQQSDSQTAHVPGSSRYLAMPSSDSYVSSSVVPAHLGPPAVQASYQPAPFRSQHYQRLLAAKLANSGQSDADASSSVANDGAASFMQHWADHTLDPNYPTPQEMSFLPSSQSPLYQLFNSGYAQDQWQPSVPVSDATLRIGAGNGNLGEHATAETHYGTQTKQVSHREMWPVNQLERVDAAPPAPPVPPYYPPTEPNEKYKAWLDPYSQPVEESDAVPNQSSRAPGQVTAQQTESDKVSSANSVLPPPASNKDRATSVQNTKGSGRESTSSPQQNDGNGSLNGGDGGDEDEPKKAMLACHFCRGRKLKCDGTRPTCAHCDKRGLSCSYDAQIRRRGPGKRKREQMAMLAAAEGKVDEDGTPLLHKLLAQKPKGKRGRKPKNRNPDGEASNSVQNAVDQGAGATGGDESEEPPYARPPNPYLPSYFIPDQHPDYPLLGPPQGSQQPPTAHYLSQPPQPGNTHMDVKHEHQPAYQVPPPQHYPHTYHPEYHTSAPWPEDLESANKRQCTEHYQMSGRW